VLLFSAVSISTVFITRKFIIPLVPDVFFLIRGFPVTHSMFVMVVFAMLMLLVSVSTLLMISLNCLVGSAGRRNPPVS
jgi:hypothetical protein